MKDQDNRGMVEIQKVCKANCCECQNGQGPLYLHMFEPYQLYHPVKLTQLRTFNIMSATNYQGAALALTVRCGSRSMADSPHQLYTSYME